ncbi:MAG TPA: serine hydrolase domain-containing protein [Chitinophaga sp.]|uniref:serine hydrolase domain-containing protein n=1 Tax=Chitinophaga sp. TaxID=1869181 RepID=UPI002BB74732|nr:serine hydrolase domain-containing protein [Chitinophaga sp.]HVI44237.1 serine hydrolase domain-containing protein [Chitinophaga sp.]
MKPILILICGLLVTSADAQTRSRNALFLEVLDSIRSDLKIPAMTVAVMQDTTVLLAAGLGFADTQLHISATPTTTFRVASITKTFAATIILQLAEEGKLNLDAPVSDYGIDLGNPHITVRHILTHTSEGEPGSGFQYNGYRFSFLDKIIRQAAGAPFYQLLMERIILPLGMTSTAPGISLYKYFGYIRQQNAAAPFFENASTHLAKPYESDAYGHIRETDYLDEFSTSGGLVSDVTDLLKYAAALDKQQLLSVHSLTQMFTPNRTKNGSTTPYGLGWFIQEYKGLKCYWHYGQTQAESGLFVKIPGRKLTLAVLTNSINLSQPFPLGEGDLLLSPVAQLFWEYFIDNDTTAATYYPDRTVTDIEKEISPRTSPEDLALINRKIITAATILQFKGDSTKTAACYQLYADLNFKAVPLPTTPVITAIIHAGVNQEISRRFTLNKTTRIKIIGTGENCSGDFSSWCDYGWIEDDRGKVVWEMQRQPAVHAGGAIKNQRVQAVISLLPGTYTLKYKSDRAHAYNSWDALPPDNYNWGITLYNMER